jgi:hypothetical protein
MWQVDRWGAVSEVMKRFYAVDRVGMVSFEMHGDKVCVYVVVYGDKDDEVLRSELLGVEEGIVRDFPGLLFSFCYMSMDEVVGSRKEVRNSC